MEKYNGTILKAVTMALKTRGLSPYGMLARCTPCSLLCTATNCSPHERLLKYARRSSIGGSVPSWLITLGPVLLKRHVRSSKDDPLVDEVKLLQANQQYAHIRYTDGRETTVSIRHLAPLPEDTHIHDVLPAPDVQDGDELLHEDIRDVQAPEAPVVSDAGDEPLRSSVRHRQPPDRLNFKICGE